MGQCSSPCVLFVSAGLSYTMAKESAKRVPRRKRRWASPAGAAGLGAAPHLNRKEKLMEPRATATIDDLGRILIPRDLREEQDWQKGDTIEFYSVGGVVYMQLAEDGHNTAG